MNPRSFHRATLFPLLAAAVLSACSDQLPSDPSAAPVAPRMTVTPTNALATIDAGQLHTCGLTSAGQSWCWGRNNYGQLGDGSAASTLVPVATSQTGLSFTQYSGGNSHGCALTSSGAAYCWGYDADGRLGDGGFLNPLMPVAVQGGLSFTTVSAGGAHTCALRTNYVLACWGSSSFGQTAPPIGRFQTVAAGTNHTCAVRSSGALACWGNSSLGQAAAPTGGFTSLSTQANHSCGVRIAGQLACWGSNAYDRATPPAGAYRSVSVGTDHSCAVRTTGGVVCWGRNQAGQSDVPGSFG
jgi:alpha-tubulin suppressor-like RCC1 family protein